MSGRSLLVVAGEVSGDLHAGALLRELSRLQPGVEFFGLGGDEMAAAGCELLHHVGELAVLGLAEVVRRYGFFRRVLAEVISECERRSCRQALLVDYPGFNLALARRLKQRGVKVLYYICPQVWAWGRRRIRTMVRSVDRLMAIFPFEPDFFRGTGLRVDFVGHPLVERMAEVRAERDLWEGSPRVALLPGSRKQEVERILPVMLRAGRLLEDELGSCGFVVAAPNAELEGIAREMVAAMAPGGRDHWRVVGGRTPGVLKGAEVALVASGTATVEAAIAGCPMIVLYRTAALTYLAGRLLVRVPHLGMVNLIAGRELCPEFIQWRARPKLIAAAAARMLRDGPYREEVLAGLSEVRTRLGEAGASRRAAEIVAAEIA